MLATKALSVPFTLFKRALLPLLCEDTASAWSQIPPCNSPLIPEGSFFAREVAGSLSGISNCYSSKEKVEMLSRQASSLWKKIKKHRARL